MSEKVSFKYSKNGIENSKYSHDGGTREDAIQSTDPGAYIIDASAKSLITHNTEYPFMQLSDDYTDVSGAKSTVGLSQAGAADLYKEIIKDEETVALAIHMLADKVEDLEDITEEEMRRINELQAGNNRQDASLNEIFSIAEHYDSSIQEVYIGIQDISNSLYNTVGPTLQRFDVSIQENADSIQEIKDTILEGGTVYQPTGNIPSTMKSTQVGNLKNKTTSELTGLSFSNILEQMLYQEVGSSVNYNKNGNMVSTIQVELNSEITTSMFTITPATITAYYVNGSSYTCKWSVVQPIGDLSYSVASTYKTNDNVFPVKFKYDTDETTPTLKTSFGNTGSTQLENQGEYTAYGKVSTYLRAYYVVGAGTYVTLEDDVLATFGTTLKNLKTDTSDNQLLKMQKLSSADATAGSEKSTLYTEDANGTYYMCGKWESNGIQQSSFVYVLLPKQLKVSAAYIRDMAGANETLKVWGIVSDETMATAYPPSDGATYELTLGCANNANKYNVWYFGKSGLNADNSVTPNQDALKVVITKA